MYLKELSRELKFGGMANLLPMSNEMDDDHTAISECSLSVVLCRMRKKAIRLMN